ncbi:hypothetical protein GLOIN_2v1789095 [Rhizophagus clarus]|uniref:Uncharacterized protein n=1 Tax=Rhizophagus clarus TaxID=94130 RepID=A0A8H3R5F3_9GLOM|nr:hypothetical protein GLOIN_2v1789095 [Rhizophagus clarus]
MIHEEVDPRTQKKYAKDKRLWKSKDAKKDQKNAITARKQSPNQSKKRKSDNLDSFYPNKLSDNEDSIPPDSFFPDSFQLSNEEESINIPFSSNFRIPSLTLDKNDNDVNYFDEENDYNIDQDYIYQEEEEEDDDDDKDQEEKNKDKDNIKNIFASSEFDSDEVFVMENLNDSLETEIILWEEEKVAIKNCLHEEFPNNLIPNCHNQCNNPLTILKKNKRETIAVPRVQREENIYSDIYDSKVWKTFPFDGSTFFTPETATTNLDLLFNLDWFQPFTYTQHSTGSIYASICNLLRSERNKPKNIIYLGFLPGPKEKHLSNLGLSSLKKHLYLTFSYVNCVFEHHFKGLKYQKTKRLVSKVQNTESLKEVDRVILKAQNSNSKWTEVQTKPGLYSKMKDILRSRKLAGVLLTPISKVRGLQLPGTLRNFKDLQPLDEFLDKILKAYNTVWTFFFNQNVDSFVVLQLRR